MGGFIQELRERGVLRVAGLYIAVVWLLLQVGEVVFPAFDIPDYALRYILYAGAGGFPLAMLITWFYEITDQGIQREEDVREGGAQRLGAGRGIYMVTILVLLVALGISVTMNYRQASSIPEEAPLPISILIADIDNQTGDPIFDGSLEQALAISMEGASFITSYARHTALKVAVQISEEGRLDQAGARLVSVREGINLVLAGSIEQQGAEFELSMHAIDPQNGDVVAEADASADNKGAVLEAVGALAAQIRESLGDVTLADGGLAASETFSAATLDAVRFYTQAQELAQNGADEEAVAFYQKAIDEDPEFGRAYSGWALSETNLGNTDRAAQLWEKTLTYLDGMTQRERYRTLGVYYSLAAGNYQKAIENYELLVENYPADGVGHNNLAVVYFYSRQFDEALEAGKNILEIYPGNPVFRSNYALYAMYAGDFTTARQQARELLEQDTTYYKAYLPLAIADLVEGKSAEAVASYQAMGAASARAASLAATGLADVELLQGRYQAALEILLAGIEQDLAGDNKRGAANKLIALSEAYFKLGKPAESIAAVDRALELSSALAHLIPASRVYLVQGEREKAQAIYDQLAQKLGNDARAAAATIQGNIHLADNNYVAAVDAHQASLTRSDAWLTRFDLGRTYDIAGYHAEALSEFEICLDRLGEVSSIFLDDTPTFHYSASLYYWLGRTKQNLGMTGEAQVDLETFLRVRSDDTSTMGEDARARLAQLEGSGGGA
jgi:tetratricopeptide (TPR) repeat protein